MRQNKLVYMLTVVSMIMGGCDSKDDEALDEMPAAAAGQQSPQSAVGERGETPNSMADGDVLQTDESAEDINDDAALNETANDEPTDASANTAGVEGEQQPDDSNGTNDGDGSSTDEGGSADPFLGDMEDESDGAPSGDEPEQTDQEGAASADVGDSPDDAEGAEPSSEANEPSDDSSEPTEEAVVDMPNAGGDSDGTSEEMTSEEEGEGNAENGSDQSPDAGGTSFDDESPDPSTADPEEGVNDNIPVGDGEDESDFGEDRAIYPLGPFFPETEVVSDLQFETVGATSINLSTIRQDPNNRVLVIYTGVAWCGSCRVHMAQYGDMLDRLRERGLALISVVRETYNGGIADGNFANTYATRNGFTHDVAADPLGALTPFMTAVQAQQPGAFRVSMIIDVDTMTLLHIGQIAPYTAEQLIEPLLAAP